ncbi:hypothetical protein BG004_003806 [Podila humilis]|nr:hypothetical protein BG004_003806 [Podila humilis]
MSILYKTARQSSTLTSLWRSSFSSQPRALSMYDFQKYAIKSAPGWDDETATESEADVKADREPLPSDLKQLQKETIDNLKANKDVTEGTMKHAPGWKLGDATQSEAFVKADREPLPEDLKELQRRSLEHLPNNKGTRHRYDNQGTPSRNMGAKNIDDHVDADRGA